MNILFFGDIVGKPGRDIVLAHVGALRAEYGADLVIANAENSAGGWGITTTIARSLLEGGIDVITMGNHTWAKTEGIEVLLDPSADRDTGFDIALVDDEGERTFVTVFGAEAEVTASAITGIHLADGDLVHASGYGLLARTNASVLGPWIAQIGSGHRVLLDPGPLGLEIPPAVLASVAGRADWLSCNLREALQLSGATDARGAAAVLRETWRAVVIRLGPEGCLVVDDRVEHVPGFAVGVLDTNGAGDAHTGAFLAGLATGESAHAAALRANACAALVVTRRGPATAPTVAEVQRLLDGAG